jgi:hypothetical protein
VIGKPIDGKRHSGATEVAPARCDPIVIVPVVHNNDLAAPVTSHLLKTERIEAVL